jgi:TP901 family phage tail tape measure protein
MADLQKIIEIVFDATDNTSSAIGSISKNLDKFTGGLEKATQPLADITANLLKFEAGVTAAGIAVAALALKQAVDLEKALSDLDKQLGEGEGSADQYKEALSKIGDTYGITTTAAITAGAEFRKSGQNIYDSLTLTSDALLATQVSELSLEDATQFLIRSMQGFGLSADDMQGKLDAINSVADNSGASFEELVKGMEKLAPAAKQSGLSFEEMLSWLTPVVEATGSGEEAGRALTTSLNSLIDPTKKVSEQLSLLGIAQKDANGAMLPAKDIIIALAQKWPTLTSEQQGFTAAVVAGSDQSNRFSALLNNWPGVMDAYKNATEKSKSATDEFARVTETGAFKAQSFSAQIKDLGASIGAEFLGNMKGAVDAGTNLAGSFDKVVASGGLAPLFDLLRPLMDAFSTQLNTISENLPAAFDGLDWGPIVNGFKDIADAVSTIFDGVDLSTPEGLQKALQGIVNIAGSLLKVTGDIIEDWGPWIRQFAELALKVAGSDSALKDMIGHVLGLGSVANTLLGYLGPVVDAVQGLGGALGAIAGAKYLTTLAGGLTSLSGAAGLVVNPFTAAAAAAVALGYGATELVKALDPMEDKIRAQEDAAKQFALNSDKMTDALARVTEQTGVGIYSYEDFRKAVENGTIAIDEQTGKWHAIGDGIDKASKQMIDAADVEQGVAEASKLINEQFVNQAKNADAAAGAQKNLTVVMNETTGEFGAAIDLSKDYDAASKSIVKSEEDKVDAIKKDVNALVEYETKMEEIASNERIKTLELAVEINVAQIEADAKKVVAAFETIGSTYAATTDLIGKLASAYASLNDHSHGANVLEEIMNKQLKLQEEQWEKEKELLDAQIENIRAKTERLSGQDPLITINTDGLEPILDELLYTVLEKIQVRANEEGQQWLLGCAA